MSITTLVDTCRLVNILSNSKQFYYDAHKLTPIQASIISVDVIARNEARADWLKKKEMHRKNMLEAGLVIFTAAQLCLIFLLFPYPSLFYVTPFSLNKTYL